MRCYIVNDKSTGFQDFLIPGCYDGWHKDEWCTCYKFINPMRPKGRKKIEKEIEALEKECSWLKEQLRATQKKNHQLNIENEKYRREGIPLELRRRIDVEPQMVFVQVMNSLKDKHINPSGVWWTWPEAQRCVAERSVATEAQ